MSRYLLTQWDPENTRFWNASGEAVARRNLWISIPALMLAFVVWSLWSVVVVNLDKGGFHFSKDQLFWLTALPAVSGATLRIFYSFLVPIFGGRRFTAISTASLLIPALGMGFALRDPSTSYPTLLALALLCGLGGANFSSSMANISFFFPKSKKGFATGMNAGIGNLGVSAVQFVTPLVVSTALLSGFFGDGQTVVSHGVEHSIWLQNAGFVWVPFIAMTAIVAWFGMNDIADAKASFAEQAVIFKRRHNWLMCVLYIGTFGSFIGFSAGLALLTKAEFPAVNPTAYTFLGPLAGALTRPVGGWISDRLGGARVTLRTFIAMIAAVAGVIAFLPSGGTGGNFAGFLAMFIVLFALTGIGNGSTFRMIPVIFLTQKQREAEGQPEHRRAELLREAGKESAAVLGFTSAIGAYGGFFIPKSFGTSLNLTGSPVMALYCFIGFYVVCAAVTWFCYARRNAGMPC
ncbi:NarK family nitrate/nitrite MFS transporter [Burkholderia ubonensis]|uniref:Nitrate/nitrite transporter n=1 Tax=Burkholderia ubonensis TaxID=101571 RepID=A0A102KAM8_9BURK|nr:NarK family nitrate/nitrite MFS transporter [Burkholderia ubonensis]KUZ71749.1 nitrate/nitrite transporter NarK [Burkholderia ubonensis]KUZ83880.1 nitrate/nitrite transporter NarK [Burkholderia ubonensis]KUZ97496.1 nitrate/nitrite transporter NarK [Burkholderia ubonensis]KVA25578.1 nitrate/nitrite transporter NarK [Burkholderia ubonensis]KVA33911.1 nitrate/nitrite transporter NarK [Burkholderia ubonensis]